MSVWMNTLEALRAWCVADSALATLTEQTDAFGTAPRIGVGIPAAAEAPCIWLARGKDGERDIDLLRLMPPGIPGQLTLTAEVWALVPHADRIEDQEAAGSAALAQLEDALVLALRGFFDPARNISGVLGAPYRASIVSIIPLADDSKRPQVGSLFTIVLNERKN
jgi:hypothetical protein